MMSEVPNMTVVTQTPIEPSFANGTVTDLTITLTIASCASSILGAIAILGIYLKFPNLRTTSRKLIVFLSVADFLTASGNLVGIVRYINVKGTGTEGGPLCIGQSIVTTYSSMCSFLWTAAISFFILLPVAKHLMFGRKFQISCHVICWILPGIIVVIAACYGVLGEDRAHTSGGWCWINGSLNDQNRLTWMIVTGKGWEISVYIITAVNYILLRYILHKRRQAVQWPPVIRHQDNDYIDLKKEDKSFFYVPALLYLLRLWGTIRFFLSLVPQTEGVEQASHALQPLHGLGDSGQAFWNFIVFFMLNSTVRSQICSYTSTTNELVETVASTPYRETPPTERNGRNNILHGVSSKETTPLLGDQHGYTVS